MFHWESFQQFYSTIKGLTDALSQWSRVKFDVLQNRNQWHDFTTTWHS